MFKLKVNNYVMVKSLHPYEHRKDSMTIIVAMVFHFSYDELVFYSYIPKYSFQFNIGTVHLCIAAITVHNLTIYVSTLQE